MTCMKRILNGITFIQDQFRNSVRSEAAAMLNQAYGNPISTSYSLSEVLSLIEEMDDERGLQRVLPEHGKNVQLPPRRLNRKK